MKNCVPLDMLIETFSIPGFDKEFEFVFKPHSFTIYNLENKYN